MQNIEKRFNKGFTHKNQSMAKTSSSISKEKLLVFSLPENWNIILMRLYEAYLIFHYIFHCLGSRILVSQMDLYWKVLLMVLA